MPKPILEIRHVESGKIISLGKGDADTFAQLVNRGSGWAPQRDATKPVNKLADKIRSLWTELSATEPEQKEEVNAEANHPQV